jgi:hypothetical protein
VTLRPASKKASPVMAARTVANLVTYSIRLHMHCRKHASSDHSRFSPCLRLSWALS